MEDRFVSNFNLRQRLTAVTQALRREENAAGRFAATLANLRTETETLTSLCEAEVAASVAHTRLREAAYAETFHALDTCNSKGSKQTMVTAVSQFAPPAERSPTVTHRRATELNGERPSIHGSFKRMLTPEFDDAESEGSEGRGERGIFVDAEELKQRIREHLIDEPTYDVTNFYKKSGIFQAIARSNQFELGSLVLVIVASLWMAVEMDLNPTFALHKSKPIFQVVAHVLCLLFVWELLVRLLAFENWRHAVRDFWCMFDLFLVALLVLETWFIATAAAIWELNLSADSRKVVVGVRILRLFRVLRLARLFQYLPELIVILKGIGIALRAMGVVLVLLGLIIYVGAIVFRVTLEGTSLGETKFPTVRTSMSTLLLDCTLSGNRGTELMREAFAANSVNPIFGVMLLCFVSLANVTMMGVLTGLLVQTVKTVAEVEREEKMLKRLMTAFEDLWQFLATRDIGSDGRLSVSDFAKMMTFRETAQFLKKMSVDPTNLLSISSFLFEQHAGYLRKSDFMWTVLQMRGNQQATVKDHVETRKFMRDELHSVSQRRLIHQRSGSTSSLHG